MKKKFILLIFVLILVGGGIYLSSTDLVLKNVGRSVQNSPYIIIQTAKHEPSGREVHVATKNGCYKFVSTDGYSCGFGCGYVGGPACYFFEYDEQSKPHLIAKYTAKTFDLIVPALKMKDENTLLLYSQENLESPNADIRYKIYTDELNLQTKKITFSTSTEYYIPYESAP